MSSPDIPRQRTNMSKNNNNSGKKHGGSQPSAGAQGRVEGLKGFFFIYGTQDEAERFTKSKKGIADNLDIQISKEMRQLVQKMEVTKFTESTRPKVKKGDDVPQGEMEGYKSKLRMVIDQQREYDRNKSKVLRLIMQQCSTAMKNKVEGSSDCPELEEKDDVIGLLKLIEQFAFSTENVQYEFWTQQASMRTLLTMQQQTKDSLASCCRRFTAQTEVTETVCGKMIPHKCAKDEPDEQEKARNKFLSSAFLAGVDRERHKQEIDESNNAQFCAGEIFPSRGCPQHDSAFELIAKEVVDPANRLRPMRMGT